MSRYAPFPSKRSTDIACAEYSMSVLVDIPLSFFLSVLITVEEFLRFHIHPNV